MSLSAIAILVNAGLVVLIWTVQLIIYPSFLYYARESLLKWHQTYTPRITVIVAPLMLIQLGYSVLQLANNFNLMLLVYLLLVLSTWFSTFLIFIPLHNKIQNNSFDTLLLEKLVKLNWIRTTIWTVILVMSFVY